MKNLIWVASYPKSGNTWLRILLESTLFRNGETVDINNISLTNFGLLNRQQLDGFLEFDSSNLNLEETCFYKKKYFQEFSLNSERDTFIKTHDANINLFDGEKVTPKEATKLAIYLMRNPLDIVASLANHHGVTNDEAIAILLDPDYTLFRSPKGITTNVDQFIGSWSNHVVSWLDSDLPLLLIRYEDMLVNPVEILTQICHLIGRDMDQDVIRKAVKNNTFEILKKKEEDVGFKEKNLSAEKFFRKGKSGTWKEELTPEQIKKVSDATGSMLKRLGYAAYL
jgi:hypothetical protein